MPSISWPVINWTLQLTFQGQQAFLVFGARGRRYETSGARWQMMFLTCFPHSALATSNGSMLVNSDILQYMFPIHKFQYCNAIHTMFHNGSHMLFHMYCQLQ